MLNKLTDKQQRFCEEYVVDLNATQAAIRSGYSKRTANEQAARLLAKVSIQEYVSELKSKLSYKTEISAEKIANEFRKLAFSSIAHMHNSWISRKEFEELTDDQKASIESIKTRTRTYLDTKKGIPQPAEIEEIQIKLYDKQRALENLGKHIGFYEADNEQRNNNHNCTDDELISKLTEFAKVVSKEQGRA